MSTVEPKPESGTQIPVICCTLSSYFLLVFAMLFTNVVITAQVIKALNSYRPFSLLPLHYHKCGLTKEDKFVHDPNTYKTVGGSGGREWRWCEDRRKILKGNQEVLLRIDECCMSLKFPKYSKVGRMTCFVRKVITLVLVSIYHTQLKTLLISLFRSSKT